jgi:hypothetical protein
MTALPARDHARGLEMEALGVSLIVLGLASLFIGLIFMLPTGRIIPSFPEESHDERQQHAEHSLEQMRKERGEL